MTHFLLTSAEANLVWSLCVVKGKSLIPYSSTASSGGHGTGSKHQLGLQPTQLCLWHCEPAAASGASSNFLLWSLQASADLGPHLIFFSQISILLCCCDASFLNKIFWERDLPVCFWEETVFSFGRHGILTGCTDILWHDFPAWKEHQGTALPLHVPSLQVILASKPFGRARGTSPLLGPAPAPAHCAWGVIRQSWWHLSCHSSCHHGLGMRDQPPAPFWHLNHCPSIRAVWAWAVVTQHWVRCCWKGGRFLKGKNDENPSHPRSPCTPDLLCPQGTEPCHGMARVCSKLHPSAQAKALWCKIAPSPSEGECNFTSPWRIALIRNFLGTTRSAELQLLALDSRHFYEILVPGLVVWHGKHIIHTQNNCIKITLGIWLKLTKPRKLRIKAESMSLTHPLRARVAAWAVSWPRCLQLSHTPIAVPGRKQAAPPLGAAIPPCALKPSSTQTSFRVYM